MFLILSYIVLTLTLADVFGLFAREVGDGFLSFPAIMTYLKDDLPSSRCLLRKFCPGELTPALLLYTGTSVTSLFTTCLPLLSSLPSRRRWIHWKRYRKL